MWGGQGLERLGWVTSLQCSSGTPNVGIPCSSKEGHGHAVEREGWGLRAHGEVVGSLCAVCSLEVGCGLPSWIALK